MTIYEEIGGAPSVRTAVELFYEKVRSDPALIGYFEGTDLARLKSHQRAFLSAALGGPALYEGRDLSAAHAGLGITDDDFDTVVGHLAATLDALDVPAETVAVIAAALTPLRGQIVTPAPVG